MSQIEIQVSKVSKDFRDIIALNDVSMRFSSGNLYGVIGPAGAGKTTLFRLMLRLMWPNAGTITFLRDDAVLEFDEFREHIAYMPQSQSLYSDLSVEEHLDFFKNLYGISPAEYEQKKQELVHLARLDDFLDMPAGKLSGGMYKKLGLICALLRNPQVMLLDEPTNGVDPISRREFWDLLNAARASGILVIMSTAYMDEAERCSHVILMENGIVLAIGEPAELLKKYNSANFDALFLARGGKNAT